MISLHGKTEMGNAFETGYFKWFLRATLYARHALPERQLHICKAEVTTVFNHSQKKSEALIDKQMPSCSKRQEIDVWRTALLAS
jgi:hypothetical protein